MYQDLIMGRLNVQNWNIRIAYWKNSNKVYKMPQSLYQSFQCTIMIPLLPDVLLSPYSYYCPYFFPKTSHQSAAHQRAPKGPLTKLTSVKCVPLLPANSYMD